MISPRVEEFCLNFLLPGWLKWNIVIQGCREKVHEQQVSTHHRSLHFIPHNGYLKAQAVTYSIYIYIYWFLEFDQKLSFRSGEVN